MLGEGNERKSYVIYILYEGVVLHAIRNKHMVLIFDTRTTEINRLKYRK